MDPFVIKLEEKDDIVIMHVYGSAMAVNNQSEEVVALRQEFKNLASQNKLKVAINLLNAEYIASNTIGVFLSGNSILKKNGGKLVIFNANKYIDGIFKIVELAKVIPIVTSYEAAVSELNL